MDSKVFGGGVRCFGGAARYANDAVHGVTVGWRFPIGNSCVMVGFRGFH